MTHWFYLRVTFSLRNNRLWIFQELTRLLKSFKTHQIGLHKRIYFPLRDIPKQQHQAHDENNSEEKIFHQLGV
jgi:hypothetical protein